MLVFVPLAHLTPGEPCTRYALVDTAETALEEEDQNAAYPTPIGVTDTDELDSWMHTQLGSAPAIQHASGAEPKYGWCLQTSASRCALYDVKHVLRVFNSNVLLSDVAEDVLRTTEADVGTTYVVSLAAGIDIRAREDGKPRLCSSTILIVDGAWLLKPIASGSFYELTYDPKRAVRLVAMREKMAARAKSGVKPTRRKPKKITNSTYTNLYTEMWHTLLNSKPLQSAVLGNTYVEQSRMRWRSNLDIIRSTEALRKAYRKLTGRNTLPKAMLVDLEELHEDTFRFHPTKMEDDTQELLRLFVKRNRKKKGVSK